MLKRIVKALMCVALLGFNVYFTVSVLGVSNLKRLEGFVLDPLETEETWVIGKDQLQSPFVDDPHVAIEKVGNGFAITDLSPLRKVIIDVEGHSINAAAIGIDRPLAVSMDQTKLVLVPDANDTRSIQILDEGADQLYNFVSGEGVSLKGDPLKECGGDSVLQRLKGFARHLLSLHTTLVIGGDRLCRGRLGLTGSDGATAVLTHIGDSWVLHSAYSHKVYVADVQRGWQPLANHTVVSRGRFWAGRTLYQANVNAHGQLEVNVVQNAPLKFDPASAKDPSVRLDSAIEKVAPSASSRGFWKWGSLKDESSWLSDHGRYMFSALMVIATLIWLFRFWSCADEIKMGSMFKYIASSTVLAGQAAVVMGVGYLSLLWQLSILAVMMVLAVSTLRHIMLAVVVYVACLYQVSAALGGSTDHLLTKAVEQIIIISGVLASVLMISELKLSVGQRFVLIATHSQARFWSLMMLVLLLMSQALLGSEAGITGVFNSTETLKLALATSLAGVILALLSYRDQYLTAALLRGMAFLLAFAASALLYLGAMHDYSPVFLLIAMALMALVMLTITLWSRASLSVPASAWCKLNSIQIGVVLMWCAVLVAGAFAVYGIGHELHLLAENSFTTRLPNADRFLVWMDAVHAPINSFQIREAMNVLSELPLYPDIHREVAIPAAKDDFAFTAFASKAGMVVAGIWLIALITLAAAMLLRSVYALKCVAFSFSKLELRLPVALFAVVHGMLSTAVLAHVLLSVASNVGMLPVVGQPLPFVSVASSHLVSFLVPWVISGELLSRALCRYSAWRLI